MATHNGMEWALDVERVCKKLQRAMELREKYAPCTVRPDSQACKIDPKGVKFEFRKGQMHVLRSSDASELFVPRTTVAEFYADMAELFATRTDGSVGTFCFQRLKLLQTKFELYTMSHFDRELEEQMATSHRDFYNVRKVDTHIHHSAAMNAKHLLRFIKKKLKYHGDDVVSKHGEKQTALKDVFSELDIGWYNLSLDKLNVVADVTVFHRFDRFNEKYNPLNQPQLRTIFLKTDNEMGGRYMAEITRELLDDLEESKYQHTEWRLSIYGRKRDEWSKLSAWVCDNNLISTNNRWMIQVPRLYAVYHSSGFIATFQDMLDNIFLPIFECTVDPGSNPKLAKFLSLISGFDSVDDESKSSLPKDRTFSSRELEPAEWNISDNPSYKYYNYFMHSNIRVLNQLRAALGMNQFQYRPHAGEAGELHHLDTAYLLADCIAHGIKMRQSMPLQYLFYLSQVGVAMSPCSNNHLFLSYSKSPFQEFFMRGLNVSLSTDDPLMFHQTKEPLMEEYSLAKQFFRLSSSDLCELARNSVLQSGFSPEVKAKWLGSANPDVNNINRSNVPNARLRFRRICRQEEMRLVLADNRGDAMKAFRAGIPSVPEYDTSPRGDSLVPADARELSPLLMPAEPPRGRVRSLTPRHSEAALPYVAPEAADGIDCMEMPPASKSAAGARSPSRKRSSEDVNEGAASPNKVRRPE